MNLEDELRRRAQQLEARLAQGELENVRRPPGWRSKGSPDPMKHCADCGDEIGPEAVRCLACTKRRRRGDRDVPLYLRQFRHARGPGGPPNEEETP